MNRTRTTWPIALTALVTLLACGGDGGPGAIAPLRLFTTCGDVVCSGHQPVPGLAPCTDEEVGDPCSMEGEVCDLVDGCNTHLTCARTDPKLAPGGCPISRAAAKRELHALDASERRRQRDALLAMQLVSWSYREAPADSPARLGFLIDDQPAGSPAVLPNGEQVDVYGFASMAVAAIQEQDSLIRELAARIDALETELASLRAERSPPD